MIVDSCASLTIANEDGLHVDVSHKLRRAFQAAEADCKLLRWLRDRAQPARMSALRDFVFEIDALDNLPAVLMPNPSDDQYCRARAANDKGVPWRRFEDTPLVEVPSAELLVVLTERGGRYLEIVARGDFNGDGWDDVVVGHSGAPSEVSPDKHDLMAMTRTQPDAVLRAIEPLDLC